MTKKDLLKKSLDSDWYKHIIKQIFIAVTIITTMFLLIILVRSLEFDVSPFPAIRAVLSFMCVTVLFSAGSLFALMWLMVYCSGEYVFYKTVLADRSAGKMIYFNIYITDKDGNSISTRTRRLFSYSINDPHFSVEKWRYKDVIVAYSPSSDLAYVIGLASDYADLDLDKLNSKDE